MSTHKLKLQYVCWRARFSPSLFAAAWFVASLILFLVGQSTGCIRSHLKFRIKLVFIAASAAILFSLDHDNDDDDDDVLRNRTKTKEREREWSAERERTVCWKYSNLKCAKLGAGHDLERSWRRRRTTNTTGWSMIMKTSRSKSRREKEREPEQ